jgi:hypothetical protein
VQRWAGRPNDTHPAARRAKASKGPTRDVLLGRVGGTARTISLGLQPVGLLVGGALIDLTGGSTTLALMGLGVATVSLAFVPIGALRRASLVTR